MLTTSPPVDKSVLRELATWQMLILLRSAGELWQQLAASFFSVTQGHPIPLTAARIAAYEFVLYWEGWTAYCHGLGRDPIGLLTPLTKIEYLKSTLTTARAYTLSHDEMTALLQQLNRDQDAAPRRDAVVTVLGQEYRQRYERRQARKGGRTA